MSYTLYIGGDDSNHAGDERHRGEINLITISKYHSDAIVKDRSNRRDYDSTRKWLTDPQRDFLFTILMGDVYRKRSTNLNLTVPLLVRYYLDQQEDLPTELKIYLDGRLPSHGRQQIREQFSDLGLRRIVVENFIKKTKDGNGRTVKRPHCPLLVYHADVLANILYSDNTFEFLSTHPNFVPFETLEKLSI